LVEQLLDAVDPDPKQLMESIRRAAASIRSGAGAAVPNGGLAGLLANPDQREVLDHLSGLMSLLEGHGDVTMDRAGTDLVPSAERFARVLRSRRKQAKGIAKIMQQVLGLEAKLAQYEEGERFIAQVEAEGGPTLLARVWEDPTHLPSIEEIRAPGAWMVRMGALGSAA
jgi:putative hydrolase